MIIDTLQLLNLRKTILNKKQNGYHIQAWWRDDDVIDDTEELKKLISFSCLNKIPVNLAVIPQKLSNEAVILIKQYAHLSVIQHGYSHTNYANVGDPLNEFGLLRSLEIQLKEIRIGFEKLITAFGNQFVPVFVPPWGHIAESVIEQVSTIGIKGISLIGDHDKMYPNLINNNVHVDIHSWKTESDTSYEVIIRAYNQIIDDVNNKIKKEKSDDDCLTIGILTHSQIMGNNDWHIFGKLVKAIKKMGIEFIGIGKILHGLLIFMIFLLNENIRIHNIL